MPIVNKSKRIKQIRVGDFKLGNEEKKAINEVLKSGHITEGVKVREFEKLFAEYVGPKYAVAVSSGTSALICGLTALKYREEFGVNNKGTKVITTPLTYIATSNAIVLTGFEPVYVDVDKETFGITPENIETHLEEVDDMNEYCLILPVHLLGYPCDMNRINKIAKKCGLKIFEDASEAHGTLFNGRKVGSMSLLSAFSFYIAHNIQVGEMGAITTNNLDIIRLIRKIKANGRMCDCPICTRTTTGCPKIKSYEEDDFDPRFTHEFVGYNFKTMEFQAALGITQLKRAEWIIKRRLENVKYLNERLEKFSDLLKLPKFDKNVGYMAYPIVIKNPVKLPRKKLRKELEEYGIETRPLFSCIPTQQPAYEYLKKQYEGKLPIAESIGSNGFYIGCHQYLTQEDLDYVSNVFKELLA